MHSAGPTAALPVPSLYAVPVTMTVPQRIMSSHSLKLFWSRILSDFVASGADSDRGGTFVSADYVASGVDSDRGGTFISCDYVASGVDSDRGGLVFSAGCVAALAGAFTISYGTKLLCSDIRANFPFLTAEDV